MINFARHNDSLPAYVSCLSFVVLLYHNTHKMYIILMVIYVRIDIIDYPFINVKPHLFKKIFVL